MRVDHRMFRRAALTMTDEQRFWAKVNKDGPVVREDLGPCWMWTASLRPNGYGQLKFAGSAGRKAHRVSWALAHGPVPDGSSVCHRCDNPACVRPSHLFLGTQTDNMRDKVIKGRNVISRLRGSDIGNSKLSPDDVMEIRRLRNVEGRRLAEIAGRFDISYGTVSEIATGRTWSWL